MASVLITGTSTGIGLATALTLGRAGHEVYATMRDPSRAPELAERTAHEKLPIKISVMDVDSDTSVKTAIANIQKDAGHIDVLVNNAGVERNGSVEELPLSEFRAVMETNYFGPIRCIQALVPQMRQRKSGCIINIASVAGHISCSPLAPYTASKFALEALCEALAGEMKTFNVRVAIVEPGIIDTAMARRLEQPAQESPYSQQIRFAHLFAASLKNSAQPSLVAEKVREIIESGTWQLRHPVGPRCTAISRLAQVHDRRRMGGSERCRRRHLVHPRGARLRHGRSPQYLKSDVHPQTTTGPLQSGSRTAHAQARLQLLAITSAQP